MGLQQQRAESSEQRPESSKRGQGKQAAVKQRTESEQGTGQAGSKRTGASIWAWKSCILLTV
jgi:hypothetical protein